MEIYINEENDEWNDGNDENQYTHCTQTLTTIISSNGNSSKQPEKGRQKSEFQLSFHADKEILPKDSRMEKKCTSVFLALALFMCCFFDFDVLVLFI